MPLAVSVIVFFILVISEAHTSRDCNRQVVRYGVDGHYHAHLDSETHEHPDFPCCHQVPNAGTDNENKCKLCRYVFHHTPTFHCIENERKLIV